MGDRRGRLGGFRSGRLGMARHLHTGVADRRVVQRRGILTGTAARQHIEGGQLDRGIVGHAQPGDRQALDTLGRGDMLPFGFQHAEIGAFLGDLALDPGQFDLGHAGLFGDMIETQDRKTHQRHAEEVQDSNHAAS